MNPGFCFYIVCDGKKLEPVLYTKKSANENIGEIFCKTLKNEIDKVWTLEAKPMIMNEEDKVNFETSTNCWICRKNFTEKNKKFAIIVISPENAEALLIKNAMHFSGNLNLFHCFFMI